MTKPHAQRISWATGVDIEIVREYIADGEGFAGTPYESSDAVIAAIENDAAIDAAFESDLPFDHAMGRYLGGLD